MGAASMLDYEFVPQLVVVVRHHCAGQPKPAESESLVTRGRDSVKCQACRLTQMS